MPTFFNVEKLLNIEGGIEFPLALFAVNNVGVIHHDHHVYLDILCTNIVYSIINMLTTFERRGMVWFLCGT